MKTLADVITALNLQYPGRWFIVGSYAAWIYAIVKEVNFLNPEDWKTILPGDIDIAISAGMADKPTLNIDGADQKSVGIRCRLWKSMDKVGRDVNIDEVEFVYNDEANKLHELAVDVAHLRLIPEKDLIMRLAQGSTKGAKNKARITREAMLKAHNRVEFEKFSSKSPAASSLFAEIAGFRK